MRACAVSLLVLADVNYLSLNYSVSYLLVVIVGGGDVVSGREGASRVLTTPAFA